MYRPRMGARISFVLVSLLAACGGDDGGNNDGMSMIDAPPASIAEVDPCPGTVAETITTLGGAFDKPAVTITQGQVVKFVSTSTHPIGAKPGTDATLNVPEGQTKCFRFTMAGTYNFQCKTHGYAGVLTVN